MRGWQRERGSPPGPTLTPLSPQVPVQLRRGHAARHAGAQVSGAARRGHTGAASGPAHPRLPRRLKISHLDSIFLSRVSWANVGGLPGECGEPGAAALGQGPALRGVLGSGGDGDIAARGLGCAGALRCFQLVCGLCDSAHTWWDRPCLSSMPGFSFPKSPGAEGVAGRELLVD